MEYWPIVTVFLVIMPFVKNKVMSLSFIISLPYFLPDYWQWWIMLYIASIITVEAFKGES